MPPSPHVGFFDDSQISYHPVTPYGEVIGQHPNTFDFDAELKGLSDGGREAFLRTLAGSLVAGPVMGIGDRHNDNVMMTENVRI